MPIDDYRSEIEKRSRLGRIKGISGSFGSGLWQIYFDDGTFCHIEGGSGLRALARCYGSLRDARGKSIRYYADSLNVMTCFEPVEDE